MLYHPKRSRHYESEHLLSGCFVHLFFLHADFLSFCRSDRAADNGSRSSIDISWRARLVRYDKVALLSLPFLKSGQSPCPEAAIVAVGRAAAQESRFLKKCWSIRVSCFLFFDNKLLQMAYSGVGGSSIDPSNYCKSFLFSVAEPWRASSAAEYVSCYLGT